MGAALDRNGLRPARYMVTADEQGALCATNSMLTLL